jgi:fatty-acyl-CoA synthase
VAVTAGHEELDEKRVIEHCEHVLADYKVPRYVVLRTEPLPRLPSGKIAKQAIRDEYRDLAERFARAR